MKRHTLRVAILAAVLVFTLPVYAQDGGGADTLDGVPLMGTKQLAAMTGPQRAVKAATDISAMNEVLTKAQELLEKTRAEERDVMKLNCINEKVSAIKGFLKIAEKAQVELDAAIASGDEKAQLHQSKLIMLASDRVQVLGEETESCVGEVTQYSGDTQLEGEIDPDLKTNNTTEVDTTDVAIDPVPDVSPYQ